jgi:hypothetical protein
MNMVVSAAAVAASGKEVAATAAERAALTFEPLTIDWKNAFSAEWPGFHLVHMRLGAALLDQNHKELQEAFKSLADQGMLPDLLDRLCETKDHLAAVVEMMESTLTRSFLVLERLGYSPENPPPDARDEEEEDCPDTLSA